MTVYRIRCSTLLLLKIITATIVIILLFVKTEIERKELAWKPENFDITFKSISYSGKHLFCPFPDARAMAVSENQLLTALNLPEETRVDAELRNFGECRAKVKSLGEDEGLCTCQPRIFLIIVVVAAMFAICTSLMHFCCGPWKPNNNCAFFKIFEGISWLVLTSAATFNEVVSHETITLPNSTMDGQRYFKPVVNWWAAYAMSYLYTALALMEGSCYLKFPTVEIDEIKESSKDTQQIVSSPSAVEEAEAVQLEKIIYYPDKSEEKDLLRLMAVRDVVQPRIMVVMLDCKTYP